MEIKIQKFISINSSQAERISKLLNNNEWNRPAKPYTTEELLKEPEGYFLAIDENEEIIGLARLKKVQWYQWELGSVNVDPEYRREGIADSLISEAEQYVAKHKGGLMQATVDQNNKASKALLKKHLWATSNTFTHPYYKKPYEVWNKVIIIKY